jgi:hypothetical protein
MTQTRAIGRILVCLALALLVLGPGARAGAAKRRVLVFPLTGAIPGDPGDGLERFTQVIARAAGLAGADVIVGSTSFDDAAALAGCGTADAACLGQVAAALSADEVVVGQVAPAAGGAGAVVTVQLFRAGAVDERTVTLHGPDVDAMETQLAREAPPWFVGPSSITPPPDDKITPPPPDEPPPPPPGKRGFARVGTGWWVLAGAGVALAAGGGYFLMEGQSRQDEIDAAPTRTAQDLERLRELEDEGERDMKIGGGLLIGGGVLFAVSGAIILYQGLSAEAAPAKAGRVDVGIVPLRGGGAVTLEVRWP